MRCRIVASARLVSMLSRVRMIATVVCYLPYCTVSHSTLRRPVVLIAAAPRAKGLPRRAYARVDKTEAREVVVLEISEMRTTGEDNTRNENIPLSLSLIVQR